MEDDPFDSLFNLEEQYYAEGYALGHADGLSQSRGEAEVFGVEQGYKKFVVIGELLARARLWEAKVLGGAASSGREADSTRVQLGQQSDQSVSHSNERLLKHIKMLQALVDPVTLSIENTDEAATDFEDRLKRAQAKAKVIEKLLGETASGSNGTIGQKVSKGQVNGNDNIEDFGVKLSLANKS